MAEGITWSVSISGSPGLSFDSSGAAYRLLEGTGLQAVRRRRSVVTAPHVDGATETSSVLEEAVYRLVVRCVGGSYAGAEGLKNALVNACSQRSFALAMTRGGVTETWQARAAQEWEAPWRPELSWSNLIEVAISIPVHPIPS